MGLDGQHCVRGFEERKVSETLGKMVDLNDFRGKNDGFSMIFMNVPWILGGKTDGKTHEM
jgi:hypothetical protein